MLDEFNTIKENNEQVTNGNCGEARSNGECRPTRQNRYYDCRHSLPSRVMKQLKKSTSRKRRKKDAMPVVSIWTLVQVKHRV